MRELVRFLRTRDYVAVEEDGTVVAVPISAVSARADLVRFKRHLAEWQAANRGVLASVTVDW